MDFKLIAYILVAIFVPGGGIVLIIKYFNYVKIFFYKAFAFLKTVDYKKTFDTPKSAGIIDKAVEFGKLIFAKYKK